MDEVSVFMVYSITGLELQRMQFPGGAKRVLKSACDDPYMENATTVIFPIGDFTAAIARKVAISLADAAAHGRAIVISLRWTRSYSWNALCELAASLRGRYRDVRVSFTSVAPTRRALLREVGIDNSWIFDEPLPDSAQRVLISA
jgi:hypothetical protein